ncbi:MAG TPA: hypothetical protein DEB39_05930 [Planctomycetaceae bacterium]|nr:hypothetical protein [Planctomycetaceae bacterium]
MSGKTKLHFTFTAWRWPFVPVAVLAVVITVVLAGCSDGKIRTELVEGTLTLDGKPLPGAQIRFTPKSPDQGLAAFGRSDTDGRYRIQTLAGRPNAGTVPGEYLVTVSKTELVPNGKMVYSMGEMIEARDSVQLLPESYSQTSKTPFSAVVVPGKNEFHFDVKSKGDAL